MSADPEKEPEKQPDKPTPRSGISPETLVIAAAASVAASFVIARIWGPGTLFGAAAAPVIVALVSAGLQRPVGAVRGTTQKHPEAAGSPPGSAPAPPRVARVPGQGGDGLGEKAEPRWARWRWALITGLVGFVIAVGVITVPELLTGHSITGNGRPTTFFSAAPKADTVKRVPLRASSTTSTSSTSAVRTVTVTTTSPTTTTTTSPTTTTATVAPTTTAAVASATSSPSTQTATSTSPTGSSSTATMDPTTAPSTAAP